MKGSDHQIIKGIDWAVQNKDKYGIDVLNLSLGHPITKPASQDYLTMAVQLAVQEGLTVTVSSGNNGPLPFAVTSPGNAPDAITVAALNDRGTPERDDDAPALFSSRGPTRFDKLAKPDIAAPGVDIVSCAKDSASYVAMSGASMAAPFAAGMVAISKQVQDDLTPQEVKEALLGSAQPMPGLFRRHSVGAGSIDPLQAVENVKNKG